MYQVFDVKESRTPPMSFPDQVEDKHFWLLRRFWIPASAGMTAIFATLHELTKICVICAICGLKGLINEKLLP